MTIHPPIILGIKTAPIRPNVSFIADWFIFGWINYIQIADNIPPIAPTLKQTAKFCVKLAIEEHITAPLKVETIIVWIPIFPFPNNSPNVIEAQIEVIWAKYIFIIPKLYLVLFSKYGNKRIVVGSVIKTIVVPNNDRIEEKSLVMAF